ncbi:MAG TPA: carboxypeptidase-like regulatory domain-containing protein [Thermoguttaceae bacterium]|nr:carboxypeptidase-like regulatory domain-containing protein [Thermoguttaceae bacterium]
MKRMRTRKAWAGWLACCGILLPAPALQAAVAGQTPSPQTATQVVDIELQSGGMFLGQVVDPTGKPVAGVAVSVRRLEQEVATTTTNRSGYFSVRGLQGGTYEITTGPSCGLYRLWAPGTAPPAARQGALIVVGGQQVRGQQGPVGYWLGNPWVVAGIVATAVAIPVAIHNSRADRVRSP